MDVLDRLQHMGFLIGAFDGFKLLVENLHGLVVLLVVHIEARQLIVAGEVLGIAAEPLQEPLFVTKLFRLRRRERRRLPFAVRFAVPDCCSMTVSVAISPLGNSSSGRTTSALCQS